MPQPLRVLFIVNHFPPDINPSGRLMSQLAESLRTRGFSVDVITSFPHYDGFRIGRAYRGKLISQEAVGDDTITRLWVFASGAKHKMVHRLVNYLSFSSIATIAGIVRRRRYDVVLANSGSFFTGIAAFVLWLIRQAPFVYNVQDLYPDVPVRAGKLTNGHIIRALERIEKFMYDRAAHITVISREQRNILIGKGVAADKVSIIPNFVDTDFIRPLPRDNSFARIHGLVDKFVVAHAGNMGLAYDFETLLACAHVLKDREDIVFLIIGDGIRRKELEEYVQTHRVPNVRILPFQPEPDLPEVRAAVDVQLSLYKSGSARYSLPSKLYEIMASGRPAIVSAEPGTDARLLIEETNSGLAIDPESVPQLVSALLRIRDDTALGERLGANGRIAAVQQYSRTVAAARYAALLRGLSS